MRNLKIYAVTLLAAFAAFVLPAPSSAQTMGSVDVTGTWQFTVSTSNGTGTPTITLKQRGDSLTGHYSSQVLGEADLKGTIKDNKFAFGFQVEVQGTMLAVSYVGSVEDKNSLKGTLDLGAGGTGTFTAKRQ